MLLDEHFGSKSEATTSISAGRPHSCWTRAARRQPHPGSTTFGMVSSCGVELYVSLQVAILKVLVSHAEGRATIAALNSDLCILNTSGSDWTDRLRRLAARAPGLDIFGQGLILRDSLGWQITPEGRVFLDWLESGAASANVPRGQAFAAPTRATATAAGRCAATTMADETWTPKTAFCLRFGRCGYGAAFFWRVDRLQARQPERGCPCPRSQPAAIQTFGLNAGMSFPAVPAWS